MTHCLAIIAARGGSKRIPRKNIRDFLGSPIIKYSIDAALQAGLFDEIMVSTDDDEIANLSCQYGASVPFLRSKKNSDDNATTADVIMEVITEYKRRGREFEYCCCIYPTAPFVTAYKLNIAYQKLLATGAHSVVPVVKYSFPIFRSMKIENEVLTMAWPEYSAVRSQDLPDAYHDSGQFYFLITKNFLSTSNIFSDFTVPYLLPEAEVQDIDNEEDWKLAEMKYKLLTSR